MGLSSDFAMSLPGGSMDSSTPNFEKSLTNGRIFDNITKVKALVSHRSVILSGELSEWSKVQHSKCSFAFPVLSPWRSLFYKGFAQFKFFRISAFLASVSCIFSSIEYTETYRSGHNELDSKSSCRWWAGTWVRLPPSPPKVGKQVFCLPISFLKSAVFLLWRGLSGMVR